MTETAPQLSDAEETRRSIIRAVIAGDMPARDAAASLGISIAWLYALRRRYQAHGDAGLVGAEKCGRSKRTPAAIKSAILELVRIRYVDRSCTEIQRALAADHGIDVKVGTLRRWLIDEELIQVRQRSSTAPARSFAFRTSVQHRYRAVRLRQELAVFRVPQQSGMTLALFKAFEALAVCAEEVLERAKHELTANDFLDLLDRMAATRARRRASLSVRLGAALACTADRLSRFNITQA